MGEHNGGSSAQPSGLLPHGLLPNETGESVIRVLDAESWRMAEERTAELISFIQPNQPSEERRNAVADYVKRLITKCFPCHVFTFGSVPLKTYLPDGDIDLSAFSENQNLKESWASQVRDMLQSEEKNENAEFRVKEVQYIQAEVKIIKCLVENIVVDISFNQLGGLCTLCFLEEVDNLINHNHLFKRSIILIKAWCYYESRILGAHHGLISTYALETLVLYIFHVFNNSFSGPLEVLYRFLEFFSKFDWENFCVSLWGPVPISSLPNVAAEPPRKDGEELLLSETFLKACNHAYAVLPAGQDNPGTPFVSKFFNVIDPLRVNNNLGRSVSKGNFFRIRSAFAFGAKRLGRLLDCPKEDLYAEINQFFMNTWDRHGNGNRPDAPSADLLLLRSLNPERYKSQSRGDNSSSELITGNSSFSEVAYEGTRGQHNASSQHRHYPSESRSRNNDDVSLSRNQNRKNHASSNSSQTSDQISTEISVNRGAHLDKSVKPERAVNDVQGRYLFARTRSSPELTDTSSDVLTFGQNNRVVKSGNSQVASIRTDSIRRETIESETMIRQGNRSAPDDPGSARHISSNQTFDIAVDSGSSSHSYWDDQGLGVMGEEHASVVGSQGMRQEEQDFLNMMGSPVGHGFNGQIHVPFNMSPAHLPVPPSILASIGFAHRNMAGMFPPNYPVYEHPFMTNYMFPPGVVPTPVNHYFAGAGLTANPGDFAESVNEKFGVAELDPEEVENDYWHEQEGGSTGGFVLDNGKPGGPSTSPAFRSSTRYLARNDDDETIQYLDNGRNEVCSDERNANSQTSPAARSNSLRSKTSSESTWDGSVGKAVKATKEKRGRKMVPSGVHAAAYGKGKTVPEHASKQEDVDDQDWDISSARNTDDMVEQIRELQPLAPLNVQTHQTSGADSVVPIGPMIIAPGSRQRQVEGSGIPPWTLFYPTGPPVPFFAYFYPPERETSDASTSHFSGEDGAENCDSSQNYDTCDVGEQAEPLNNSDIVRSAASGESPTKHPDILNSDFGSHWQNLQYGRSCQNPQQQGPVYPSPAMVPPAYLQGRFPWDGPGRPPSPNMNMFPQPLNYGTRLVPVPALQSVANRPASVFQPYVDDISRYRSGTGTYLPNPKVSVREKHTSGNRRGNFNHHRNDHHDDREGNWNNNKYRPVGRNHSRNQAEKSGSRLDRFASENRSDRPWGSHRPDSFSSYQSQNGFWRANHAQSGSTNAAYGMYPATPINSNGVSSNGPSVPSMVMLYPQDNSGNFVPSAEQLEFGSLRAVGFSDMNEASQVSEGGRIEEIRFHSNSAPRSSPDQPSSPHHQRRI